MKKIVVLFLQHSPLLEYMRGEELSVPFSILYEFYFLIIIIKRYNYLKTNI